MIFLKKMGAKNKQGFLIFENSETSATIEIPIDLVWVNMIHHYLSKIIHKPGELLPKFESDEEDEEL